MEQLQKILKGAFFEIQEIQKMQTTTQKVQRIFNEYAIKKVACHNDLGPHNMVQNADSLWLLNWDHGTLGDPWIDIATLLNFTLMQEKQENMFLDL